MIQVGRMSWNDSVGKSEIMTKGELTRDGRGQILFAVSQSGTLGPI